MTRKRTRQFDYDEGFYNHIRNEDFIVVSYNELKLMYDPYALTVYLALRTWANWWNGENCYPSAEAIMARTGLDRKTIFEALNRLEEKKWIKRKGRARNGKQTSNEYEFLGFPTVPLDGTMRISRVPLDGTVAVPLDGTPTVPLDGTVAVPLDGTRTTDTLTTDKKQQTKTTLSNFVEIAERDSRGNDYVKSKAATKKDNDIDYGF